MAQAQRDFISILMTDHEEMMELIGRIEGTESAEERRDLTDTVIAEIMRHAVAEEMFVYPAIAKHVPGGEDAVERDKDEHDEIVQVMKQLERTDTSAGTFSALLQQLKAKLAHHIASEETLQLPALRRHLSADDMTHIAHKVQAAKKIAPTRPHPHAPHSELFHKTLGGGVGLVDRIRDTLTGRKTHG
jgi:hemerythrin-like domain-containing protein